MKKRLRKKLHLKEFSEYGIYFKVKFHTPISDEQNDKLIDDFIDLVEKNNTYSGGGGGLTEWNMVVEIGTEKNKENYYFDLIKKFFEQNISKFDLSYTIINLWYPSDDM